MAVRRQTSGPVEIIQGPRAPWSFRAHFHMGDEVVEIIKGKARLRFEGGAMDIEAGQSIAVPAGTMHRFEPVDAAGWSFRSTFIAGSGAPKLDQGKSLTASVIKILMDRQSLHSGMDEIARLCSLSTGHLSRRFRKEAGTSLHNFHVMLSLQRAKALLKTNAPLADTAVDCGFYDQAHLSREFVRTFGLTPGAFRTSWADADGT